MRIFYFFMLAFSVAFHILYKGDLSFVLLAFMAVLPFVMLLITIVTAFMTDASAHFEQMSAPRGSSAVLKVTVRNRSIFPLSCCAVEIIYKSHIPFDSAVKNRYRLRTAIGGKSSEIFAFNISAEHCGTAEIYVKRLLLKDYLKIFSIPIKVQTVGKSISLPVIYPIRAEIESMPVSADESDTFSPYKPGDDPSEIFALREYREGDSNNRIHWKLSSRNDNFIVKELSLPVGCRLLIVTDFCGCKNASEIDRILDAAFSVSDFLSEHGTTHTMAYVRSDFTVKRTEIDTSDKRMLAATEICSELENTSTSASFAQAAVSDDFFASRKAFSRVIIFTDNIDYTRTEELESLFGEACITVICTGSPDSSEYDEKKCKVEIIYADAEKLGNSDLLII